MTDEQRSEHDTMNVGQPEEAELAKDELERDRPAPLEVPDEEKAEEELEPLEGGAETIADLDEEERRIGPAPSDPTAEAT